MPLRKKNLQKTIEQLQVTFEDLQTYLLGDILSDEKIDGEDWFFIPMIFCGTVEEDITFDDSCLKHIMIGMNFLTFTFTAMYINDTPISKLFLP